MAEILTDDFSGDDRRRLVGAESAMVETHKWLTRGRSPSCGSTNVTAECHRDPREEPCPRAYYLLASATKGSEPFLTEVLMIVEINVDERKIGVDRHVRPRRFQRCRRRARRQIPRGRGGAVLNRWSVVVQGYAALNRNELPLMTPDAVSVDHRRGRGFTPGDLRAYLHASWELMPQNYLYIDAVHRLSIASALVSHVVHGTTGDGFDAEWREIALYESAGDRNSRCEVFDEEDFDAALARFDELQPGSGRLEHPVQQRFLAHFAAREWDAFSSSPWLITAMIAVGS